MPRQVEVEKSELKVSPVLKSLQQLKVTTMIKTPQKTTPKEQQPKPKIKPPFRFIPKLPLPTKKIKKSSKEVLSDMFEIFTRKAGKDIKIGEAETQQEAQSRLTKELRTSLRASGFIERKGQKVEVSNLFGGEFAPSKKDIFRVVQRREKRLSTRPEVSEIQSFKRRSKKQKWL
jgi:hypothetical protein